MKVTGTPAAARAIDDVRRRRSGDLVITIGTGCCDSTAPFLYEDFWPGPDEEIVGEVAGVPVYAPAHLRSLYPGGEGFVIDIDERVWAESFSIETETGARFALRSATNVVPDEGFGKQPIDVPATVSARRPLGPQPLPACLDRLRRLQAAKRDAPPLPDTRAIDHRS